jgi:hypothetical protein
MRKRYQEIPVVNNIEILKSAIEKSRASGGGGGTECKNKW